MGRGMIDLTGQRFGRLRVVDFAGMAGANRMWLCVCDCGTKTYGAYPQSENRQYDVMRMSPSGPSRASTEKDTTAAGAETDTQWTPAKLGSVGEETKIPKQTIYYRLAGGQFTWPYRGISEMDRWLGMVRWRRRGRNPAGTIIALRSPSWRW